MVAIENHPLLVGFGPEDRQRLIAATKTLRYPAKSIMFEENDPSDGCLLVLDGEVSLVKQLPDDKEQPIRSVQSGQFFGEIGVITQAPRSLKAIAQTDVTIGLIPTQAFMEAIQGLCW